MIPGPNAEFTAGKCYEQLQERLAVLVTRFSNRLEGAEKNRFASNLCRLFDEMYRSLLRIAENIKNCDEPMIFSIASVVDDAMRHLINLSEAADKAYDMQRRDKFAHHLDWFMPLPGWYVHYALTFASTYAFDTLADIPVKAGLILGHLGAWPEKAVKCAEAAFSITMAMLEKGKERHGCDEPRHMLATCYVGIWARAKQDVMVVNAVVRLVRDFRGALSRRVLSGRNGERVRWPTSEPAAARNAPLAG